MAKRLSHYEHLKRKWTKRHEKIQKKLWSKHGTSLNWLNQTKQLMAGSAASLLMLTSPTTATIAAQVFPSDKPPVEQKQHNQSQLITDLKTMLPESVQPLNDEQETSIGATLTDYFKMPVSASLQNIRLNRSYGLIGQEQHLTRYPGDTMETHGATDPSIAAHGMAPDRGAWRYFADSRETMTEQDSTREKYYIAVPTFLSPGWNEHSSEYYNFYKFRKMLVVNPENGKALVADIGDAGPAEWTGKHLGGSPEVMHYLERVDGSARGPVLYFFIDDPEDKVPLGPITIP